MLLALARARSADLDVADLADHAGYSPFHFARMFAARTGIGPGQYLTAQRMDTARRMLLHGDDAVIDVATAVGFSSLSSFSRRFRAVVGVAPGAWRHLADDVADHPPRPFSLLPDAPSGVRVHLDIPAEVGRRGDASVWVGWYPSPAPFGLPHAGLLVTSRERVELPLCPGAPFLLGFAVPAHTDVLDLLTPEDPWVAAHPAPLHSPATVTLRFRRRAHAGIPMLSALPALRPG